MTSLITALLSTMLISAHFFRADMIELFYLSISFSLLIFVRSAEAKRILQVFCVISAGVWVHTTYSIAQTRIELGHPYFRMAIILTAVALFSILAAWLLGKAIKKLDTKESVAPTVAFYLTTALLYIVSIKVKMPMILGERFFGEVGVVQIFLHGIYSAWITKLFITRKNKSSLRFKIWSAFSIIFFAQLALGLSGFETFLQTGNLHYPVPAMIVAGPLFRGEGFFMIILLLSTILLVGPSWCGHLCYVGAIDSYFAKRKRVTKRPPEYIRNFRYIILGLTILLPMIFALFGFGSYFIHTIIGGFIVLSLFFIYLSYSYGSMVHCAHFCPVGVITNVLGKVNPFRLKIGSSCNLCNACINKCKYNALSIQRLEKGSPNMNCTLCMDCVESCHKKTITLNLFGSNRYALPIFYVIVVSLHSVFMAVARI